MRNVVVLPAPLGPSRPVISPSRAVNDTPSTAFTAPNALWRFLTSIMGCSVQPFANSQDHSERAVEPLPLDGGGVGERVIGRAATALHPSPLSHKGRGVQGRAPGKLLSGSW